MALRAAARRRLPSSSFAYPSKRLYPIDTKARARNALARAAQSHTRGTYRHVAMRVKQKWGNAIDVGSSKRGRSTRRRRR